MDPTACYWLIFDDKITNSIGKETAFAALDLLVWLANGGAMPTCNVCTKDKSVLVRELEQIITGQIENL